MGASIEDTRLEDAIVRSAAEAATLGMAFQLETRNGSRRFLHVGPRCEELTGVTAEAALADAEALYGLVVHEHRGALEEAGAEAGRKLHPFDIELAIRHAGNGEVRWQRIAAMPSLQPDGSVLWDGLQINVARRRQMAEELDDQRRRVEIAVEATDLGLWELDLRTNQRIWSDRQRALFGLGPDEEITDEIYRRVLHPDDYERVVSTIASAQTAADAGDLVVEFRVVRPDGETRWMLTHGRVIRGERGPQRMVGTCLDITERKAAEERRTLLLGELAHRAKNGLAVVMAMVRQSARGQTTVAGFEDTLMARLQAMATSQDLVTASGGRPVDLGDLIRTALAAFDLAHFEIDPSLNGVTVPGEIAVGAGLLLHELATNAVKYGALSNAKGRVCLMRETSPAGRAAFGWREAGGPLVAKPTRQGFGTRLLQQALRNQGGEVAFRFEPEGFEARAEFPAAQ